MALTGAGCFITLEGIEGAGKSTIAERLEIHLNSLGRDCLRVREPGGTPAGERLRELLLHDDVDLAPETELFIIEAARAQLMHEIILPALEAGKTVILDRHTDSTLAYQGFGRGLAMPSLTAINAFAVRERSPDWTLLFDIDPEEGLKRARHDAAKAENPDRFERETLDFLNRVREGFLSLAQKDRDRMIVIDAQQTLDAVWKTVQEQADKRLFGEG